VSDDAPLRERLRALGAASVLDASAGGVTTGPSIRPVWWPVFAAGPAFTINTDPADNLALHRAIGEAPEGAIVVAATQRSVEIAIFGDLLSRIAIGRGLAGLVTDGAVRDIDRIREVGFPVFCGGVTLRSPTKRCWGEAGITVAIGDARIGAGDWVVGDGDGVVVVAAGEIAATVERAEAIRAREGELVRRAIGGEATVDLLGLRPSRGEGGSGRG
jgi:4-hydroxy-4-methyl-2-oxoglutarate aldolase